MSHMSLLYFIIQYIVYSSTVQDEFEATFDIKVAMDTAKADKLTQLCKLISGVMSAAVSGNKPIPEDLAAIASLKHIAMQLDSIVQYSIVSYSIVQYSYQYQYYYWYLYQQDQEAATRVTTAGEAVIFLVGAASSDDLLEMVSRAVVPAPIPTSTPTLLLLSLLIL